MLVSFSLSFVPLKYLRKACILFWLLGLLACKDFKSWESRYSDKINIAFDSENDKQDSNKFKDLQSYKLSKLNFKMKPPATNGDTNISLNKKDKRLPIPLDPDANEVSFELESLENNMYYHKVTIRYKRIVSLISPEAGGRQIQYVIEGIKFSPKGHKRPIFKEGKIENPVPLKEEREKDKTHVILYY